jgi:hypothetical protein
VTWTEKVQLRLAELGFDPGPADGILGNRTRRAIHEAQDWHSITAGSDVVDDILWPDGVIEDRQALPPERLVPRSTGPWPHESAVPAFYGQMGKHLKRLELPYKMRLAWDRDVWISSFSIHEKCHDSAARVFARIAETFDEARRQDLGIDVFSGCLTAPRKKIGGSTWSMHSWAVAIDFDDQRNQLKWGRDQARLGQPDAVPFWKIWEAEGWVSLGRVVNYDWMHVQCAQL